jgi:ABC-type uncharacterized transport system permease subunit
MPDNNIASGSEVNQQPAQSVAPEKILNFTLGSDGKFLGPDGKKYIPESDLIALKNSHEKNLSEAQNAHNTSIDGVRVQLSTAQQEIARRDAKIKELEEASKSGAISAEEKAKYESELSAAKSSVEQLTNTALEYRRSLMAAKYPSIKPEQLKDKTSVQLDALEEALQAVGAARGAGNYAIGGGSGGGNAPISSTERAQRILQEAASKGHVYGPLGQQNNQ